MNRQISTPFSKQLIAAFFCLLFSATFLLSFTVAVTDKRNSKFRKSSTELLEEGLDILATFGGETVSTIINEFLTNLKQTTSMLKDLSKDNVIDSINHLIKSSITSLADSARQIGNSNASGDKIVDSDFREFTDTFKQILDKKILSKKDFSTEVSNQVKLLLPALLGGLNEVYENIVESTGFGLTFGMLSQGTALLTMFERPEYVSKDTFKSFVSFPEEIKQQLDMALDQLIGTYIDPSQLEMMMSMAKMYAQNFASKRTEKEEL